MISNVDYCYKPNTDKGSEYEPVMKEITTFCPCYDHYSRKKSR